MVEVPAPSDPLWRTVLDVFVAGSTIAVAFFAFVELKRAGADRKGRTKAANTKVSAVAYALRRQLRSWLEGLWAEQFLYQGPQGVYRQMRQAQKGFDVAESRMQDAVATAVDATSVVQEALREAYVRFYSATGMINYILQEVERQGASVGHTPVLSKWSDCVGDLQATVALLDRVIDPALQSAEDRLAVLSNREEPPGNAGRGA
jgi:hypothetical protein